MKTILHAVPISAAPATIYETVATERGLAGWWSTKVKADVKVGGIVDFTFAADFNPDMEITALEPSRLVTWKCVGGHEPWTDNTFRFAIEARGEASLLLFQQEYARELSDEQYGVYNYNWGYYLNSLKRLCERGVGTPFGGSGEDLKAVVGEFVEEYKNRQNPDIVDKLVTKDCEVHIPLPGLPQGREGLRVNGQLMCSAFPDVHVTREFILVDEGIVVERAHATASHQGELMGVEPTGKPVTWTELHAYRIENGKISEVWSEADFVGILGQIGAIKMP